MLSDSHSALSPEKKLVYPLTATFEFHDFYFTYNSQTNEKYTSLSFLGHCYDNLVFGIFLKVSAHRENRKREKKKRV